MKILINASNLRVGGGIQVADSVLHHLEKFSDCEFVAVLCSALRQCGKDISAYKNVTVLEYDMPWNLFKAFTGRDSVLDKAVQEYGVDSVLTVFGPSRWCPKVPHLCGFARPQVTIPESPYWKDIHGIAKIKANVCRAIVKFLFRFSGDNFFTENPFISERVKQIYPNKKVYTVTNNYNQIFDNPQFWDKSIKLPEFSGFTMLTVSANYPHKNLKIIRDVIKILDERHPDLKYRFVLTLDENQYPLQTASEKEHIVLTGGVSIDKVPFLYEQCDVMFLPTLLECFSASYAEAMRMGKAILTTNLEFAKGLCGDAACYYSAVDAKDLASKIILLAGNPDYRKELISAGELQLQKFDTAEQRAEKLVEILKKIV